MQNDLRLSVSKTKTFEDCKKKYHFSYILKLPQKDQSYHIFGKFLHKILEDFHLEYLNGSNEPPNKTMGIAFKNAKIEYKDKITKEQIKEAYDIIDNYLKKFSSEKQSKVLSVEKPFNLKISENIVLNGVIDRVQLDPDGVLHIADYKTTKNKKYLKNDFFQLLTYAYAIYKDDEKIERIRGSYILLRHDFEYITKDFYKDDILAIKDKYDDYAKRILNENLWEANTTYLCNYCPYLELCEQGQAAMNKMGTGIKNGEISW